MMDEKNPIYELLIKMSERISSRLNSQPFLFVVLYFLLLLITVIIRPEVFGELKFIWLALGVTTLLADIIRLYISRKASTRVTSFENKKDGNNHEMGKELEAGNLPQKSQSFVDVEQKYLAALHVSCQSLVLGGIDPYASDPRKTHMELRGVYVDLATTELAINDNGKNSKNFFSETIRVSALRTLNEQQYLVLLGAPGTGKSTLINFVTLCLSGERLRHSGQNNEWIKQLKSYDAQWKHGPLFPIRISLHRVSSNDFLIKDDRPLYEVVLDILIHEIGGEDTLELRGRLLDKLVSGDVILLFDGLDEIIDVSKRAWLANSINAFVEKFPLSRYVVTCRSAVYPRQDGDLFMPWHLKNFKVSILDEFEDSQINQFIDGWYNELVRINRVTPDAIITKTNQLKEKINSISHIRKLAGKPLLLTVMVILFDHGGGLPEQKAKLYDQCFDLLLWKWEIFRHGSIQTETLMSSDILTQLSVTGIIRRNEIERTICKVVFDSYTKHIPSNDKRIDQGSFKGIKSSAFLEEFKKTFEVAGFSEKDSAEKAIAFVVYLRERSGVFIQVDDEILAPLHRSFQDYLIAKYICSQRKFTVFIVDLVYQNYEMWREIFVMAIGQKCLQDLNHEAIDAVTRLINLDVKDFAIRNNFVILSGEALREIGTMSLNKDLAGRPLLDRIQNNLLQLSQFTSPLDIHTRIEIGGLLSELGDPRLKTLTVHGVKVVVPDIVLIPPGEFEMGSSKGEPDSSDDEISGPPNYSRQLVEVDSYYISKYLITEFEYELFIRDTGHRSPKHWVNQRPKDATSNLPITNVSWFDAIEYCNWLQKLMSILGKLESNYVVRLPTEAEWEKAARWDFDNKKSYIYPWGDEWRNGYCNNLDAGILRISPIGVFPDNSFGLYDVAGNVIEWCNSVLSDYPYSKDDTREAFYQPLNKLRSVRGGSWNSHRRFVRAAFRSGMVSDAVSGTFGFRIVIGHPL